MAETDASKSDSESHGGVLQANLYVDGRLVAETAAPTGPPEPEHNRRVDDNAPMLPGPYRIIAVVLIGVLVLGVMFIALRLQATYRMQTDVQALRHQIEEEAQKGVREHLDITGRLLEVERILFDDVVVAIQKGKEPPKPKPAPLPISARERLAATEVADLKKRIEQLERWRIQGLVR